MIEIGDWFELDERRRVLIDGAGREVTLSQPIVDLIVESDAKRREALVDVLDRLVFD